MISVLDFCQNAKIIYTLFFALLGLCMGSWINIMAHWLPQKILHNWYTQCNSYTGQQATFSPLSLRLTCSQCTHPLPFSAHLPLHILYRPQQCRRCQQSVTKQYLVIEIITATLFAWIIWHGGLHGKTLLCLLLITDFILLTCVDLSHRLLPDCLTLSLLWLGLLINTQALFVSVYQAIWGASLGYISLWLANFVFKYGRGIDGMGHGDFKFLAMLGAWWGAKSLLIIVMIASSLGCLVGCWIWIRQKKSEPTLAIPFGPFLAIAGFFMIATYAG